MLFTKDNVPCLLYKNVELPLYLHIDDVLTHLKDLPVEKGEEWKAILTEMYNDEYPAPARYTEMVYLWISSVVEYINQDVLYEYLHDINLDDIYGVMFFNHNNRKYMIDVYIMNPRICYMVANTDELIDDKTRQELLDFKFTEKHYWSIISNYFSDIKVIFGGYNCRRENDNIDRVYTISPTIEINTEHIPDEEGKYSEPVHIPNVPQITKNIVVKYEPKIGQEWVVVESGELKKGPIKLFQNFESEMIAQMYTYSAYMRFMENNTEEHLTFPKSSDIMFKVNVDEDLKVIAEYEKDMNSK